MPGDVEGLPVAVGVRDPYELARVGKGPAVVRTLEPRRRTPLGRAEQSAAVRAPVEQSCDAAVLATSNYHGAPSDPTHLEVVGSSDLTLVQQVHPGATENSVHFVVKYPWVGEHRPVYSKVLGD